MFREQVLLAFIVFPHADLS